MHLVFCCSLNIFILPFSYVLKQLIGSSFLNRPISAVFLTTHIVSIFAIVFLSLYLLYSIIFLFYFILIVLPRKSGFSTKFTLFSLLSKSYVIFRCIIFCVLLSLKHLFGVSVKVMFDVLFCILKFRLQSTIFLSIIYNSGFVIWKQFLYTVLSWIKFTNLNDSGFGKNQTKYGVINKVIFFIILAFVLCNFIWAPWVPCSITELLQVFCMMKLIVNLDVTVNILTS